MSDKDVLQKVAEKHDFTITEIADLIELEKEYQFSGRRFGLSDRLKREIESIIKRRKK